MKYLKFLTIAYLLILGGLTSRGQDSAKFSIDYNVTLISRYILHGTDVGGNVPSIQPSCSLKYSNFGIGAWGAFPVTNVNSNELDWFINYTIAKMVTIQFMDVFFPNDTLKSNSYFDYSSETTRHNLNGSIAFNGPENFPICINADVYFYGADKDTSGDNRYSTYAEISYNFHHKNLTIKPFLGITPAAGYWGDSFGVVNTGVTLKKDIKINNFSLPTSCSIIINPQAENVFFVFGFQF